MRVNLFASSRVHRSVERVLGAILLATCLLSASAQSPPISASNRGTYSGAKETVYPPWFKQSFLELDADIEEATQGNKRVLVLFHQNGCPYCNALVEQNLSQKSVEVYIKRHFDVIHINIWGDRTVAHVGGKEFSEKSFARALKVQFTPTLLFFDEQGRVVLRLNGYVAPAQFALALKYVASRLEKELSYQDFLRSNSKPSDSSGLIAEPFFRPGPVDLQKALSTGAPLAVYFEQAHCPDCETLHRQVLSAPESQRLAKRFHAVQLDMWSEQTLITPAGISLSARDWARELNIVYAPTIVLFDPQGNEVIRSESALKRFHTQSILDYVLSGSFRDEANFQRYLSARAEHLIEQGVDVNIWE